MIEKHVFAVGMEKDVYEIQADEKVRFKCHSNSESMMQYVLVNEDAEGEEFKVFKPGFLYMDTESVITSHKFQSSGKINVKNLGPGVLHLWVYSGDSYGAA